MINKKKWDWEPWIKKLLIMNNVLKQLEYTVSHVSTCWWDGYWDHACTFLFPPSWWPRLSKRMLPCMRVEIKPNCPAANATRTKLFKTQVYWVDCSAPVSGSHFGQVACGALPIISLTPSVIDIVESGAVVPSFWIGSVAEVSLMAVSGSCGSSVVP